MKTALMIVIMTLVSTMAMATDSGPSIEPGQVELQDSQALNILLYKVPSKKMADLKAGSNRMAVQTQRLTPNSTKYIYRSAMCQIDKSLTGIKCTENKVLVVIEALSTTPGSHVITKSYKFGEVVNNN